MAWRNLRADIGEMFSEYARGEELSEFTQSLWAKRRVKEIERQAAYKQRWYQRLKANPVLWRGFLEKCRTWKRAHTKQQRESWRRYVQANPEKEKARQRAWNSGKGRDYKHRWYEANKERLSVQYAASYQRKRENKLAKAKVAYAQHREEKIARQRAYYEKNREQINAKRRKQVPQ